MRIEGETPRQYPERAKPILRSKILEAIENTVSNSGAAKYLGVSLQRYKKYASIYGLYEQHNNKTGIGTTKGFAKSKPSISLTKIFNNEYPNYSIHRLKGRLIRRRILEEKCAMCGFSERRITDGRVPVLLTFKEKSRDFTKSNLWLLCYNCMFLTTGSPIVSHAHYIEASLLKARDGIEDKTFYPADYDRPHDNVDDHEKLDGDIPDELEFDVERFQNELLKELREDV
jgi:hypothetical protein